MKPEEVVTRSFYLYPTTDQAAKYECAAILKASDFSEVDRAECQFTTTATILDNGSQIVPAYESKENGINGFLESIKSIWKTMWEGLLDFFSGKTCRSRCSSFFDFSCHIQYICVSWILMFGLLLAIFPTATVLLWLLHQKGFFDPLYDWWEDRFGEGTQRSGIYIKHAKNIRQPHIRGHGDGHMHLKDRKHPSHEERKRKSSHTHHVLHKHSHPEFALREHHHLKHGSHLHVHKESHKHKHSRGFMDGQQGHKSIRDGPLLREIGADRGPRKMIKHNKERQLRHKHAYYQMHDLDMHSKQHNKDFET